jgi:hypothetical protein
MADSGAAAQPKPSSSVKLVLLGEAAVGKVCINIQASVVLQANIHAVFTRHALREQ